MPTDHAGKQRIVVTDHALERFKKRFDLRSVCAGFAKQSFVDGQPLPMDKQAEFIAKGLFKDNYWLSYYRVFKNCIFVFRKDNDMWILVTILPYDEV